MSKYFACVVPEDPIDERLWKAYLEQHGCEVIPALLSDNTSYYQVTLPSDCARQRIGGELEPVYRFTLPDGAILIERVLEARQHNLVIVGLPEDDWKQWVAEHEQAMKRASDAG